MPKLFHCSCSICSMAFNVIRGMQAFKSKTATTFPSHKVTNENIVTPEVTISSAPTLPLMADRARSLMCPKWYEICWEGAFEKMPLVEMRAETSEFGDRMAPRCGCLDEWTLVLCGGCEQLRCSQGLAAVFAFGQDHGERRLWSLLGRRPWFHLDELLGRSSGASGENETPKPLAHFNDLIFDRPKMPPSGSMEMASGTHQLT